VLHGTATFETEPPSRDEMASRVALLADRGFPFFVAVDETGDVLGYAYAGPYRARAAYRHTVEDSIYLAERARGRGVGTTLLARLITASQELGFRQMVAVIGDSANRASIALHRKAGFRHVGTLEAVGWKHGRWLDSVLMQLSLGAGAGSRLEQ
jgi:L-amino acid N-acyltransferase YncA